MSPAAARRPHALPALLWRPVLAFLGRLVLVLAAAMTAPVACSLLYGEFADAGAIAAAAALAAACGLAMRVAGRRAPVDLYRREGVMIVVGGWVLASVFGALPYLFAGTLSSPMDALFEAASGFTTTGATVLTAIEAQGRGILFWRSFTQWLGGMGIIVLFVALLPELGPGRALPLQARGAGPDGGGAAPAHPATPRWCCGSIYLLFTVAETALLMLFGMNLYDALTHTFSTLSTGGFSPRIGSLADYPRWRPRWS